jgi:catechol 2,3-dioxygenase-like lactoylglutathione lyase family enzyme
MSTTAYVEHVAIRVRDIQWHIRFFQDVLGMAPREVRGPVNNPWQCWTIGGLQLIAAPHAQRAEGDADVRLAHIGVMCDDLDAALRAARDFDVSEMPQGRNWLRLPDGLVVELMQASPRSVEQALAVTSRASSAGTTDEESL